MGNGKVQIAYLHKEEVSHSWHDSMRRLVAHDRAHDQRLNKGGAALNIRCAAGQLVPSRNYAAKLFLDETDAEWLFFVDTDMGFEADIIDRLLDAADPADRPVVGALCFAMMFQRYDRMGGMRCQIVPTMYRIGSRVTDGKHSFSYYGKYPPDTLTQVAATGMAAILIHRSALEVVRAKWGDVWYNQVVSDSGNVVGEDFSLCLRWGALNVPVYVHTGVQTTHHKEVWLAEEDYLTSLGAVPEDHEFQAEHYVPPAIEPTAVVVPAVRPDAAKPFMQSLRASTGLATVYALVYDEDEECMKAWEEAGAEVVIGDHMTFAEKANAALTHTAEPWIFLTGEDVRFYPGWLDRAQYVAQQSGASVVGTNDLGWERVRNGDHATHMLISRSYIDQLGASWDGPGVLAHEGYRHWFVDDEIVAVAKQRGSFAAATDAIVEHLHPFFGKATSDRWYRLGQSHASADQDHWERRLMQHGMPEQVHEWQERLAKTAELLQTLEASDA